MGTRGRNRQLGGARHPDAHGGVQDENGHDDQGLDKVPDAALLALRGLLEVADAKGDGGSEEQDLRAARRVSGAQHDGGDTSLSGRPSRAAARPAGNPTFTSGSSNCSSTSFHSGLPSSLSSSLYPYLARCSSTCFADSPCAGSAAGGCVSRAEA